MFESKTSNSSSSNIDFVNWLIVRSNLILGDNPNAVENLKIVGPQSRLFLCDKIYFSTSTFCFAYKDIGLSSASSLRGKSVSLKP